MAGGTPSPPPLGLPEEILAVLPTDPFEQLDVARKITSIALSTRVSALEAEADDLRRELAGKDGLVEELRAEVEALGSSLADIHQHLARIEEEKASLASENVNLSNTVRKLNKDVAKLEAFKKTLMQSLHEEDDGSKPGAKQIDSKLQTTAASLSSGPSPVDEQSNLTSLKLSSVRTQFSETGSAASDDAGSIDSGVSRYGAPHGFLLASYNNTPKITPPDSPTKLSTSTSPKVSRPERRHSVSIASMRNAFEERSVNSSLQSPYTSMSGSLDSGAPLSGRSRVDGKEFFRQVRTRLSYEQFSMFLASVKELNSHKLTKEETLRKADEIFGPENRDLYAIFEGLITRNHH